MKNNKLIATMLAGTIAITSISTPAFADRKANNAILTVLGLAALVAIAKDKSDSSNVSKSSSSTDYYTHRHNGSTHKHATGTRHNHDHVHNQNNRRWLAEQRRQEELRIAAAERKRAIHEQRRQERIAAERRADELRRRDELRKNRDRGFHKLPKPISGKKLALPSQCKRTVEIKGRIKNAYAKRCLMRNGYTVSRKGTVRHPSIKGRNAQPNLI